MPLSTAAMQGVFRDFEIDMRIVVDILAAADKSTYFSELLNKFYGQGNATITYPATTQGTRADSPIQISIDPFSTQYDKPGLPIVDFMLVVAHELAHAVLKDGYSIPGVQYNPDDAISNFRTVEGVARVAELVVAVQLGTSYFHSSAGGSPTDPVSLRDKLLTIAETQQIDISKLTLGSTQDLEFRSAGSLAVATAGTWASTSVGSTNNYLNYDQSAAFFN